MPEPLPAVFPNFQLDIPNQRLLKDSQPIQVRKKTFSVLQYLVEHPDQLVSKDQLLDAIWPDAFVTDTVLKVCIGELRKVLGDDPKRPRFVETVHGRGYRWIGEIPLVERGKLRISAACFEPLSRAGPPESPADLLDRQVELARLEACLGKALQGQRQVAFVMGESGMGKTALLEAFVAESPGEPDLCIMVGQCQELHGQGEAYMPVLEALELLCREAKQEQLVALLSRHAPSWLAQMPWLLSDGEHEALQRRAAVSSPERMLREFAGALEVLSADVPLVLILEDLQWSDPSTLDLVSALARRRVPARILLISSFRPMEELAGGYPLQKLQQNLRIHGRSVELALEGLSPPAVKKYMAARLAGNEPPADLVELVHHLSDGNPLFLGRLVDDLLERGYLVEAGGEWQLGTGTGRIEVEVPDSLRQLIQQQFEALSEPDRRLLEVGSVIGTTFSAAAVASVMEREAAEIDECYDRLARRGHFLRPKGTVEWPDGTITGRYAFTRGLYQKVLYQRLPASRRQELTRRLQLMETRIAA